MTLTPEQIEEIAERERKATKGPWDWEGDYPEGHCPHDSQWTDHGPHLVREGDDRVISSYGYDASGISISDADAEFISKARTDIPALLSSHRELQERVEELEKLLVSNGRNCISQIILPPELAGLEKGWDGYDGIPPTPAALETAQCMSLVPGGDGSLQFEIHANRTIEINIGPDGSINHVIDEDREASRLLTTKGE